jgi:DNA-binding NarL/FixJ family response regulator
VGIAGGDPLVRTGLRSILDHTPRVRVAGEAASTSQAVALVRRARLEILLLEDSLPGAGVSETVSRCVAAAPALRVAVLSDRVDAPTVASALRAGAKGYLPRTVSARALDRALRALAGGEVHLDAEVSRKLLRGGEPRERLTPRQRQVLRMVAEGGSTKEIARILRISAKTVETHRAQLMERLGIFDVPGLVRYALKNRITRL